MEHVEAGTKVVGADQEVPCGAVEALLDAHTLNLDLVAALQDLRLVEESVGREVDQALLTLIKFGQFSIQVLVHVVGDLEVVVDCVTDQAGVNGHDAAAEPNLPQPSYKLDAQLSNPLGALPASTAEPEALVAGFDPSIAQSLAVRNLLRGKRLGLASGQDVARAMGIEPLTDEQLLGNVQVDDSVKADLAGRAPLWFYCLKEAEVLADSAQLGPVGGRIVAEVLIGLLSGDPLSFLSVDPLWRPTLPSATTGEFTLTDIINIAIPAPEAPTPPVYGG